MRKKNRFGSVNGWLYGRRAVCIITSWPENMRINQKCIMAVVMVLAALSSVFIVLSMLAAVATPNVDIRNPYITPEGKWTELKVGRRDSSGQEGIARAVGAELRILRSTKDLLIQSNNWGFLASVLGVLAGLVAVLMTRMANKQMQNIGTNAPDSDS